MIVDASIRMIPLLQRGFYLRSRGLEGRGAKANQSKKSKYKKRNSIKSNTQGK
ncbi:MAG: hypothetical protein ACMUEL_09115 [Flavobacteriales bacterium Tduv]